jgi:hypothetical protein
VRLVIVWTIIFVVPHIELLLLVTLPISAPGFNSATCISAVDDIVQVTIVSAMPSTVLLWWSNATVQVPTWTMPVATLVTLVLILLVMDWICYSCCI